MLSLFLFSAVTEATKAQVFIDMEAWSWGRRLDQYGDDEVHEDTSCNICAGEYKKGRYTTRCKKGLINRTGGDHIEMHDSFDKDADWIVLQTDCNDALWIDRLIACEKDTSMIWPWELGYDCYGGPAKTWGKSDEVGLCLSTDRNDWKDWNSDGVAQYVHGSACFRALRFNKNGSIWGYNGKVLRRLDESDESEDMMDDSQWKPLTGNAIHKVVVVDEYVSSNVEAPEDRRLEKIQHRLMGLNGVHALFEQDQI